MRCRLNSMQLSMNQLFISLSHFFFENISKAVDFLGKLIKINFVHQFLSFQEKCEFFKLVQFSKSYGQNILT